MQKLIDGIRAWRALKEATKRPNLGHSPSNREKKLFEMENDNDKEK